MQNAHGGIVEINCNRRDAHDRLCALSDSLQIASIMGYPKREITLACFGLTMTHLEIKAILDIIDSYKVSVVFENCTLSSV